MRHRAWVASVLGAALLAAACGGGGGDATVDTTAGAATTVARSGAIASIDDAKQAVVQIVTQGSFRDPEFGQTATAGTGSGFIIDPDGIIVTNNHVVTGAGAIKVRVGGSNEELPARVLGVSECNDLAVIQLTDPGPYPYLEWYEGEAAPPLEVYAAGFPLGDPEYTVTRGVVSKAKADGDVPWASVRHVIEHDANIQPGNSGGPLLTKDGKVVAVNYAGGDVGGTGTSQFFAIAGDLARPVVERLKSGDDETIGVNGEAVFTEDGSIEGVWVAGVAAGSPAAKAGVLPGDIITSLNGVPLTGGTMAPYCDVLRSARPGGAIGIQVLRFDTEEVLEGEINGKPLEARFSFAQEVGGDVPAGGQAYSGYRLVTDDTGTISVEVPNEWRDIVTAPQDINGTQAPSIQASPDLAGYQNTYDVPGMEFAITDQFDASVIDPFLDALAPNACRSQGRQEYSDPVFSGRYEVWTNCGGRDTVYVTVVVTPIGNPGLLVVVVVQAVTQADLDVLDRVLNTFNFA